MVLSSTLGLLKASVPGHRRNRPLASAYKKRLGNYYKSLLEKRPYVSEEHMRVVHVAIGDLNEWKTHLQERLVPMLKDIRMGITKPPPMIGQETEKLLFLTEAVAAGAIYISHSESPLEKIKTPSNDPAPPTNFDPDTRNEWDTRRNEKSPVPPENGPSWHFPVATDTGENEDAQGAEDDEDDEDAEELEPPPEYCLARYAPDSLKITDRSDEEDDKKPMDRRFIRIPCPGIRCNSNTPREWKCFQCSVPLEFGVTDDYIYCDCGHCLYSSYDFKCNGKNHGPGFNKYPSHTLLAMLRSLKSLKSDSINILILSETGVGKSTFINDFANYLTYNTLDEAKAAKQSTVLIPCSFSTQIMDRDDPNDETQEYSVRAGGSRDDERDGIKGQSATQQTNVYPITIGTTT
ncbi:hypothetical protein FALCPG4_013721 [Fusarium falciforme]